MYRKIYALDISGEIPKELFELKKLMDLNLAQNVLSGSVPPEIGQLSDMQYLSLGINNLTGPVPQELGNLTKLISLSFSSNSFVGQLPKELGKLTLLQQLYIDSSGVTGPIPQEFASLKALRILWASDNLFTGKLPEFLGDLTEFIDLRLEGTSLEGPIPSSFSALTKLETLRIGDLNKEDSSLKFLENQTSLSILTLRNCRVSGEIPKRFGGFSNLQHLYLGNNNLSGELPNNIITPKLIALDVSFNGISGNVPTNFTKSGFSMNVLGTSIIPDNLSDGIILYTLNHFNGYGDRKSSEFLRCLQGETKCSNYKISTSSFSVKSGGTEMTSASGIKYDDDSEKLGSASIYTNSKSKWAVSNTGNFLFNPNGPQFIAKTDSQITKTLDSELYKTARVSPSSLRYFGYDMMNGKYAVELHFAEIAMDDTGSWKALGRRLFDVYIQGEKVLKDFDIKKEAGGSKRALVKTFEANVTNKIMEIHFFWAGKGTCCIPFQGTYGPLVSAVHVYQATGVGSSSKENKKRIGRLVGITLGCAAGFGIVLSMLYLWWTKRASSAHMPVQTDSPKK
ncbi:putative LRR receptor-like serine/threonine-protein kinase [Morus notabilis]|uniref:non-specific serine/threonine protein kinase n=1 Tax=Morus notabilis TaxID=981085 RepID=W9QL53_9ROSA|nr:putative LRR receptor-like serine/threonine-protein kinase [Morus notabilis]